VVAEEEEEEEEEEEQKKERKVPVNVEGRLEKGSGDSVPPLGGSDNDTGVLTTTSSEPQPPAAPFQHQKRRHLSLRAILLQERLPVVALPGTLKGALVKEGAVRAEAGPEFVRHHFGGGGDSGGDQGTTASPASRHPCLDPQRVMGGFNS
jgi:hypothetical protein